jgi:hypothetical protein
MNENFEKVLKESTYDILGVPQVDQKKFTKLIIEECIKLMHEQERIPEGFFYAKNANIHELVIKQHFGVEDERAS